jgi:peptidoglycan hydrolase-like protein with peptidoglycan-binding domain
MKRAAAVLALALLAACAGRARTAGSAAGAPPPAADEHQAVVVQPEQLSPEQVRLVQRTLSDRGFALEATGRFDDATQTALMDFQRARALPPTGNLNAPTVDALGLDPREVAPARGLDPTPPPPLAEPIRRAEGAPDRSEAPAGPAR